ncbi:FhaA domain-containing protein [Streptomyces durmitorensis]
MRLLLALERAMERWMASLWGSVRPPRRQRGAVVSILCRECDERALILERGRTVAPNTFTVELPRQSHVQLASARVELGNYLAHEVHRHAAEQGYTFAGPVAVSLCLTTETTVGRFRVQSRISPATRT